MPEHKNNWELDARPKGNSVPNAMVRNSMSERNKLGTRCPNKLGLEARENRPGTQFPKEWEFDARKNGSSMPKGEGELDAQENDRGNRRPNEADRKYTRIGRENERDKNCEN